LFHGDFPDGIMVSSHSPSKEPVQTVPVFGEHYNTFNRPSGPLDVVRYEHLRSMEPSQFEEYVSACGAAAWQKFKVDHSSLIKIVCIGGPISLLCIVIPIVNIAAILYLMVAFFGLASLTMSAFSHTIYVRSYKNYVRRVRGQVVRSREFNDYLTIYSTEKI